MDESFSPAEYTVICPDLVAGYWNDEAYFPYRWTAAVGDNETSHQADGMLYSSSEEIVDIGDIFNRTVGGGGFLDWANNPGIVSPGSQKHHSTLLQQHDEDMQRLKYYSYGIALPTICVLGIVGNVLNLIVLTRPTMKGPAYVYMRGW